MKQLSILIPTLPDRKNFLKRITTELLRQIDLLNMDEQVEIITCSDLMHTTGTKRNELIKKAKGEYICFVDDDDMVTDVYVQKQLEVCNSGKDCGSLIGLYFINGVFGKPFTHSIKYNHWYTDPEAYRRCPNHLNAVKREIALQIPYKDITVGEDGNWSMDLQKAGLLKTEHEIKETLYLYYDRTK